MSLYLGIILGITAMFAFGISKIYLKKLVQSAGEFSVVYVNSVMVVLLFLAGIFTVRLSIPSFKLLLLIAALGFVGALTLLVFMKALKMGHVAIVVPVSSVFGVIIVAFAILILKESLTYSMVAGITLIILGTILISFKHSDLKNVSGAMIWSAGTGLALVTAFGWGTYYFFIRFVAVETGPIVAAFYVELSVIIFLYIFLLFNRDKLQKPGRSDYKYIFINALLVVAASIAYYTGITVSKVSVVAAITSAAPLVSSVLAIYVLKEKIELNQKLATLMIVAGVIVLAVL
ncbi:MAG: DMT family transporter [Nanoarchaeota archaeon]|nr:DMT family transporter [Nanoarchaeota archaeon]